MGQQRAVRSISSRGNARSSLEIDVYKIGQERVTLMR